VGGRISSTFKRFLRFGVGRDFCGPPGEFLDHASEDHASNRAMIGVVPFFHLCNQSFVFFWKQIPLITEIIATATLRAQ
jgi:hypothetical protein